MSIETTLRTFLLQSTALTAAIAQRLYYQLAPQEVIMPYVVYWILDDPNDKTEVGADGANPVFTFRIVAARDKAVDITTISDAIRAKICDYTGLISTTNIYRIECVNLRDFPPEEDTDFLERFCDYQVSYER